jgi:hypothetical protein
MSHESTLSCGLPHWAFQLARDSLRVEMSQLVVWKEQILGLLMKC